MSVSQTAPVRAASPVLRARTTPWAAIGVAALTAVGLALRLAVLGQSPFGDEMSTWWIVHDHSLGTVVSLVHGDYEITPPLYFVLAWLTTRLGDTVALLRLPSLLAGTAAIPLVYLVGRRTVGRPAALLATALTVLSPFMVYYSTEARSYGLLMALVLTSTLALLIAVETGRARWWVLYGAATCGAVYTHYTGVFVLGGQLLWALWAHPRARRPALTATAAAALLFLVPWLTGLRGDFDSPTTRLLSALQPFTPAFVRTSLAHWAVGYPYAFAPAQPASIWPGTGVRSLPGDWALVLLAVAVLATAAGLAIALRRRPRRGGRLDRGAVLVVVLLVVTPVGEALVSLVSSNLFGCRNLAASWPGLALVAGLLVTRAGRRAGVLAAALAIAAFGIGAVKLLDARWSRPDFAALAGTIDRQATAHDVVVDGASLSPAGMPGSLVPVFDRPHRLLYLDDTPVAYNPFRILGPAPSVEATARRAVAAAAGGRVFFASSYRPTDPVLIADLARTERLVERRRYPGVMRLELLVFAPRG